MILYSTTYSIKMSAMMFIPRNIQNSAIKYRIAKKARGIVVKPGRKTKLYKKVQVSVSACCAVNGHQQIDRSINIRCSRFS